MERDKEYFKNMFNSIMKGQWDDLKLESVAEEWVKKYSTIVNAPNAVHLEYLAGILSDQDLIALNHELKKADLVLSSFDSTGVAYNSFEEYKSIIELIVNEELVKNILYGVTGSIVYDSLIKVVSMVFSKTKGKEYNHYSNREYRKKAVTFGIRFNIDRNTGLTFQIDKHFTEESVNEAIEKAKEELVVQVPNSDYHPGYFYHYNHDLKSWVKVDIKEELDKDFQKFTNKKPRKKKRKK